jgi:hypothetical protein
MSQEEFKKQFEIASALVATWPVWKQNILEYSSSPTVSVARTPVDNQRISEECDKKTKNEQQPPPLANP